MSLSSDEFRKIQDMIDRAMPRTEYENRHTDLVLRISKLETAQAEMARYILAEMEKTRIDRETNFEKSMEAIDKVRALVDGVKDDLAKSRSATLSTVIGYIVSFVVGGGALGLVEFLRSLH